ncbi:hypothetical protein [Methanobrevibacter curvatus]|uniref:Uncharacterized protein n=1 Tax=Methanobrevibacter curvatus TaxID=49547 RepID=A0A166BDM1_9EURY|nr:hypothetical protein [Methanobrevibacter curvatus]KZX13192.1 hypothetical protein MBCUR_07190 [Methanobrevibacter curvatus]
MISTKQAISSSLDFVNEIFDELKNLKVEEIEFSNDDKFWKITLGWEELKEDHSAILANPSYNPLKRTYKTFYVDKEYGEVKKMKNWKENSENSNI